MSAPGGPDVAALLTEHMLHDNGKRWVCVTSPLAHPQRVLLCRWSRSYKQLNPDAAHKAHQGQVIREAYADWLENGDAFTPVEAEIHSRGGSVGHVCDEQCDAYREAANAALSALADLLRGQA